LLTIGEERANRRGAVLVGAAVAVAVTAGIALAWTSDSAQVDTVARPAAPTIPSPTTVASPTPRPPTTPSLPATTAVAPEPEVALPDAYRVFLGMTGMVLRGDGVSGRESAIPGPVAHVIQGPSSTLDGPVAMLVVRPLGEDELPLGRPVTADGGKSGVLNTIGDLAISLSWRIDDSVMSLTTYGYEEAEAIKLMGRLTFDPTEPQRALLDPEPGDDLVMVTEEDLWTRPDYQINFCSAGGDVALWRQPSVPRNLIGLVLLTGAPIEELSLDSGEWFLMNPSAEQTIAVTMSDTSMVVAIISGLDPEPILNAATSVTRTQWEELLDAGNVTAEQQGECPAREDSVAAEPVGVRGDRLFGEILMVGDVPVAICDGVGPGVPGRMSGATPDAPVTGDSAGALSSYVEWWTPGLDQPNNMPARGWWVIPDGDSVAYAWDGGSGQTVPQLFFIVLYTERGPDGWSVTRWESSGC